MGYKSTLGITRDQAITFLMKYIMKISDCRLQDMVEAANDDLVDMDDEGSLGLHNFRIVDDPDEYNKY